jgi:hypothetical protein
MKTFLLSSAGLLVVVVAIIAAGAAFANWAARFLADGMLPIVERLLRMRPRVLRWSSRLLDGIAGRRIPGLRIPERRIPEPEWKLSLLVDADDESGAVRPSVFVRGPRLPEDAVVHLDATIRLDVVDSRGCARLSDERAFRCAGLDVDVDLNTLTIPEDTCAGDAAGWDWNVVLRDARGDIARRRGPLFEAGRLNAEAELETPDPAGA